MSQLIKSSLQEINEIVLATGVYQMDIPSSTQEQIETITHNYGRVPFFTYQLSLDGNMYFPHSTGQFGDDNRKRLMLYADKTTLYLHYFFSTTSGLPAAFTYYIRYKLYITEAAK